MPNINQLKDKFNHIDTSLWYASGVVADGVLTLTDNGEIDSKNPSYTVANSSVSVQLVSATLNVDKDYAYPLCMYQNLSNALSFAIDRISGVDKITVYSKKTATMEIGQTYDPDVHKYFKIRVVGDIFNFECSTDGKTWFSVVDPIEDTSMDKNNVTLIIGVWSYTETPVEMVVDNLNIPATPIEGTKYALPAFKIE